MAQLKDLLRTIPRTSPQPGLTRPDSDDDEGCENCGGGGIFTAGLFEVRPGVLEQRTIRCEVCNPERPYGIPPNREGDTFETFDLKRNSGMKAAYERCLAVANGEAWDALLHGVYGTGKTHLAIAALNRRSSGTFWKAAELLDWVRRRAYTDNLGADVVLDGMRWDKRLLVIDDYGTEKSTEWVSETFYRILDTRYDARLPTIVTSNFDFDRLDERVKSRFSAGLIICDGKDQRRAETA